MELIIVNLISVYNCEIQQSFILSEVIGVRIKEVSCHFINKLSD